MASLLELKKRFQKVTQNNLQNKVKEIITNDQTIIEAKQNEYERGLLPTGDRIGVYAWSDYAQFKESINPLADGYVDLKLTGSFHSQLFVKSLGNSRFLFDSRDSKANMLANQYGEDIFGLNKHTFEDLQSKKYANKLVKYIKQLTNL